MNPLRTAAPARRPGPRRPSPRPSPRLTPRLTPAALAAALLSAASPALATGPFEDKLLQPPRLAAPERASLAGSLSGFALGPGDLARGAPKLASPFDAPAERGPLLARVFPSYSPDAGASEWGASWSADLSLRRYRPRGEIDYTEVELTGPWGVMKAGDDGARYPAGFSTPLRLVDDGAGGLSATDGAGTTYLFRAADAVTTARGTYAWMLSEVRDVFGDSTELTYERNASGRPFLSRVRYGGRGGERQYEIEFVYEPLAFAFDDYRSGERRTLDRRVREVRVKARVGARYEQRHAHRLSYAKAPFGPAFHLVGVEKVYRSGAAEPKLRYDYDAGAGAAAGAALEPVARLDDYLAQAGSGALLPSAVAFTDVDDDGLADLEHYYANTLVRQTPAGLVYEDLPPPSGVEDPLCRPPPSEFNPPRHLARMGPEAGAPQVVAFSYDAFQDETEVHVCERAGARLGVGRLAGDWSPGPLTRLVDLDRDDRPDLVRFFAGGYQALENVGTPGAPAWAARPPADLTPAFDADAAWMHDMNGDGVADLVARFAGGLAVWPGRGDFRFGPEAALFGFELAGGGPLDDVSAFEFTFADANRDGLADALLSHDGAALLFVNEGMHFRQAPVPALDDVPAGSAYPTPVDLSGSGEDEIVFVAGGRASALRLTRPSTGLLVAADDGKGGSVAFGYGRAAPAPGLRSRPAVLASLTSRVSGEGEVTQTYAYEAPVMHGQGKFLVGFAGVTSEGPLSREALTFHHDDDLSGLVLSSRRSDPHTPALLQIARTTYEEASYRGLRLLRPLASEAGVAPTGGGPELVARTEHLTYERGVCPTRTRATSRHGALETTATLTSVTAFDDGLHCLASHETIEGKHADPSLDFRHELALERDDRGQLERATASGPEGPLALQEVSYDELGRVTRLSAPGRGSTAITYDASTGLLATLTGPEGQVTRAAERDPVGDQVKALSLDRGGLGVTSFFRYDGFERLAKRFRDLGTSSEAAPLEAIEYAFATADAPASVRARTLVAPGSSHEAVGLATASGEGVATFQHTAEGWVTPGLTARDRALGETRSFYRLPLAAAVDPRSLDHAALAAGAVELSRERQAGFGHAVFRSRALGAGAAREDVGARAIAAGDVVDTSIENGRHATRRGSDEAGRALWSEDEAGVRTAFGYDALGRLASVTMPKGARHELRHDAYGRPAAVRREGVGSVLYAYDPASGLPREKQFVTPSSRVERTSRWQRDGLGRVISETHALGAGGPARAFSYEYDGRAGGGPPTPGQLGSLTRVVGEGYERENVFERDGLLRETSVKLGGWRAVREERTYFEDGTPRGVTFVVSDGGGAELARWRLENECDARGRLAALRLDGAELARLAYDAEGKLASVDFAGGEALTLRYDALTRAPRGYHLEGDAWAGGVDWALDARGRVGSEAVHLAGAPWLRTYDYDARGLLISSRRDGETEASYAYDEDGLPLWAADAAGARSLAREGVAIASANYEYDELGRLARKGDLSFTYGPDGEVESARRGGQEWRFVYDENRQRVLKTEGGAPVAAYVAGGLLSAEGLAVPLRLAGRVVGVVENGAFRPLATDPRGTLLGDGGPPGQPSPYGVRAARPALSATLDYVERGYDRDLGTVRMGARDYDPELGQFTTPDPLFLEDLSKCAESPRECNLYGYALGDPVSFVDPSGLDAKNYEQMGPTQPWQFGLATRSFAPWERFGGGFEGDNRGFSMSFEATARIHQYSVYDLRSNAISTQTWSDQTVARGAVAKAMSYDAWIMPPVLPGAKPKNPPYTATATPEGYARARQSGPAEVFIAQGFYGKNPVAVVAPAIAVNTGILMRYNARSRVLEIFGDMRGDGFPSAEMFVVDSRGSRVSLTRFATTGTVMRLTDFGDRPMSSFRVSITLDEHGNFTDRVMYDH